MLNKILDYIRKLFRSDDHGKFSDTEKGYTLELITWYVLEYRTKDFSIKMDVDHVVDKAGKHTSIVCLYYDALHVNPNNYKIDQEHFTRIVYNVRDGLKHLNPNAYLELEPPNREKH